jgi:tRNA threonylcarbamoyl adenosine modification protein (Sua5/YciO/YrdC/YwlC family)
MIIKIYPENPNPRDIKTVIECLRDGGVIIYPTDTVYSMGCDIFKPKAVERVAAIKGVKVEKADFSIICNDLSHISDYSKPFNTEIYKLMKKALPGPFTFILQANTNVPRIFQSRKKTIGIRVPDNSIIRQIVEEFGNPVISTSIYDEDEIIEYTTDPELIHEKYINMVDLVIDGGYGGNTPSTVVDCTGESIELIRQGKGDLEEYL